jgi:hypothetical protein
MNEPRLRSAEPSLIVLFYSPLNIAIQHRWEFSVMKFATFTLCVAICCLPLAAEAQMVIVDENFNSYADTNALHAQWVPSAVPTNGILNTDPFSALPTGAFEPGDQGVDHIGGNSMRWATPFPGGSIAPTATQNVVLEGDIFDLGATNNKRMTIGLRSTAATQNILELGFWNSATGTAFEGQLDGNNRAIIPGYAFRLALFGVAGGNTNPNWQFFEFDQSVIDFLDRPGDVMNPDPNGDADSIINPGDIGEEWHRFRAEIGLNSITLQLDLFRDGLINNGTGDSGWDATMVIDTVFVTEAGFDDLRIGSPSNVSSPSGVAFDNIYLALEPAAVMNTADFNGDGVIDAADYTIWRDNLGLLTGATQSTGDANGDGAVDTTDYSLWRSSFGTSPAAASISPVAVPEPASLVAALAAVALLASVRRVR